MVWAVCVEEVCVCKCVCFLQERIREEDDGILTGGDHNWCGLHVWEECGNLWRSDWVENVTRGTVAHLPRTHHHDPSPATTTTSNIIITFSYRKMQQQALSKENSQDRTRSD